MGYSVLQLRSLRCLLTIRMENRGLEDNPFVLGYHLVEISFELLASERVKDHYLIYLPQMFDGENVERFGHIWAGWVACFFCPEHFFLACGFRAFTP